MIMLFYRSFLKGVEEALTDGMVPERPARCCSVRSRDIKMAAGAAQLLVQGRTSSQHPSHRTAALYWSTHPLSSYFPPSYFIYTVLSRGQASYGLRQSFCFLPFLSRPLNHFPFHRTWFLFLFQIQRVNQRKQKNI